MEQIEMKDGDAAILLHANGDIGLLIPKLKDEDAEPPEHVALTMAFAVVCRTPVLRHIVMRMAETAAEAHEENSGLDEPSEALQ